MEHDITPVKNFLAIWLAIWALQAPLLAQAEQQRLAIVASADSNIKTLSAKEVRRAYLGASIVVDGVEIKPLRNLTQELAEEVFLQKVLFMSGEAYDRQLLARTFRGAGRPKAYDNLLELLMALHSNDATITYMLYGTAVTTPGIRIINYP
jgi:hypothetical protein